MIDQEQHIKEIIERNETRKSQVIAVTSGKGGVGKSNVSLNLAIALAEFGKKVVVIDADSNFANIDIMLGISPKFNVHNFVLDDLPLEKIIVQHPSGIDVIANSSGSNAWQNIDELMMTKFFDLLYKLIDKYDFIVLDTAAGVAPLTIDLATRSDSILMVTTAEPTAISDTYAMIKLLDSIKHDAPINLLQNMVSKPSQVTDVYERLSLVLQYFLDTNIGIAGYIAFDENVRSAVEQQRPFIQAFPDSIASSNIRVLAKAYVAQEVEKEKN